MSVFSRLFPSFYFVVIDGSLLHVLRSFKQVNVADVISKTRHRFFLCRLCLFPFRQTVYFGIFAVFAFYYLLLFFTRTLRYFVRLPVFYFPSKLGAAM